MFFLIFLILVSCFVKGVLSTLGRVKSNGWLGLLANTSSKGVLFVVSCDVVLIAHLACCKYKSHSSLYVGTYCS